ncbi:branched-chain amino acid transport system II carrier protein [Pontibacillus sp. ALD_SL1]|uniref:branched-chain amino acid transport system II carrier protein n=1 Tax=Pontibacillus sp. ALD_SL1 TaxID=2777185 RepID=UPI0021125219|nr:branched-chain amino acid transport system II carrier protein [Pontibacillus sp. ALD_SL1]
MPGWNVSVLESVQSFYDILPLYSMGLGWMLPAILGVVIGLLVPKRTVETPYMKSNYEKAASLRGGCLFVVFTHKL